MSAAAVAHPNIALIKYWGNRDAGLRLPANGSISLTLDRLETRTQVAFEDGLASDELKLDGRAAAGQALERVGRHLDLVRERASLGLCARVQSSSNFPSGVGVASSAAAFAALTLAAASAAGLDLAPEELSRIARRGSGSACRSIFAGYVEWSAGVSDHDSHAAPLAPPDHWPLVDCVAIVSHRTKSVDSTAGHARADTSPIQAARVADADRRLAVCRRAIQGRDFEALAAIVELDSNLMHAVMMTSSPPLWYWLPETISILRAVEAWRRSGIAVCATVDAGPNVHCLCEPDHADAVERNLRGTPGVLEVIRSGPGAGASIVPSIESG